MLVSFSIIPVNAKQLKSGQFKYVINADNTVTITGHIGKYKNNEIIILERIDNKKVKAIGSEDFRIPKRVDKMRLPKGGIIFKKEFLKNSWNCYYVNLEVRNKRLPGYVLCFDYENNEPFKEDVYVDSHGLVRTKTRLLLCHDRVSKKIVIPKGIKQIDSMVFNSNCFGFTSEVLEEDDDIEEDIKVEDLLTKKKSIWIL